MMFTQIWRSARDLPVWVRIWVLILAAVNMATLIFLDQPMGVLIAALALGGMVISTIITIAHRGFSKLVSGGHVITWTPLVLLLILAFPDGTATYQTFLGVLLVVNSISLVFDINDLRLWFRDRARAQRNLT